MYPVKSNIKSEVRSEKEGWKTCPEAVGIWETLGKCPLKPASKRSVVRTVGGTPYRPGPLDQGARKIWINVREEHQVLV